MTAGPVAAQVQRRAVVSLAKTGLEAGEAEARGMRARVTAKQEKPLTGRRFKIQLLQLFHVQQQKSPRPRYHAHHQQEASGVLAN